MNWADLVVLILILALAGTEVKRGFGMALFTLIGAFLALKLAGLWAGPLSRSIHLQTDPGANQGLLFLLLFLVLVGVMQLVTYVLHPDTFLSLDPFDNLFGGICGVATGWIAAYVFLQLLLFWGAADVVRGSRLAPEIREFQTYHRIVSGIRGLGRVGNETGE